MRYIDISQPILTGMKKYPSDPLVEVSQFKSLKRGNSCNLCRLVFGSHTGTHIDAPRHIFDKAITVDNIKIKDLICDVIVTDINNSFDKLLLKKINRRGIKGVLLKNKDNKTGLSIKEAKTLLNNGIKVIGIEQMSIEESSSKFHPVHRLLLSNGVVIIESLYLKKVKSGYYKLICLPLKIKNADGAPARAILIYD